MRRAARRRGLSEMIGALFLIALVVVAFGVALTVFTAFRGYQDAVSARAQQNSQASQEKVAFGSVFFGATSTYSPNNGVIGNFPSAPPADFTPVGNMNFTQGSGGWVFAASYAQPGVHGVTGAFDPSTPLGSDSGPGEIYSDFTYNQGTTSTVSANGVWTTQFTLSSAEVAALSSGSSTIYFSYGYDLYTHVVGPRSSVTVTVILQDAVSLNTVTVATFSPANQAWTMVKGATLAAATQHSFFSGSSGTYNLILQTAFTVTGRGANAAEYRVYFDDVGARLRLTAFDSGAICPAFQVAQARAGVQDLTVSVSTIYTAPVTQTIYVWDFTQGELIQVDSAVVGTSSVTRYLDLGALLGGAGGVQKLIQTGSGSVTPQGCPSAISTSPGTVIMEIYAASSAGFTGTLNSDTLTVYYSDPAHVSLVIDNTGTGVSHLVALWVIGPPGATQFASTLSGGSHFEEWIGPGQTAQVTVAYSWTPGEYTLELVSSLGNVFTESVSVS